MFLYMLLYVKPVDEKVMYWMWVQQLGSHPSSTDSPSSLPQLPLPVIETNSIKVLCGSLPLGPVTGMSCSLPYVHCWTVWILLIPLLWQSDRQALKEVDHTVNIDHKTQKKTHGKIASWPYWFLTVFVVQIVTDTDAITGNCSPKVGKYFLRPKASGKSGWSWT